MGLWRHFLSPRGWAMLFGLVLSACVSLPPTPRPMRGSIEAFTLEGRVSVRRDERPYHGGIHWEHTAAHDEILLTGPLGQGLAALNRDANGARLVTSDGKEYRAENWGALADEILGLTLPLDALPHWLAGNAPIIRGRDAQGRPRRAESQGWQIEYLDYESDLRDALPTLLELQRERIHVKLKIDQWQLP